MTNSDTKSGGLDVGERPSTIDRTIGLPLFLQVKDHLLSDIAAGHRTPGDRLPSERALCERFQVSRVTMRKALAALGSEGLIETSNAARGWYVATRTRLSDPPNTLVPFTDIAQSRGLTPSARILEAVARRATSSEADALDVAPGAPVFSLKRVRLLDDAPVALDHSVLTSSLVRQLEQADFRDESLYRFLETVCGAIPTRADYLVEAALGDDETSAELGAGADEPVIVLSQVTFDQTDRVIELGRIVYPASIYRFRATMFRHGEQGGLV